MCSTLRRLTDTTDTRADESNPRCEASLHLKPVRHDSQRSRRQRCITRAGKDAIRDHEMPVLRALSHDNQTDHIHQADSSLYYITTTHDGLQLLSYHINMYSIEQNIFIILITSNSYNILQYFTQKPLGRENERKNRAVKTLKRKHACVSDGRQQEEMEIEMDGVK